MEIEQGKGGQKCGGEVLTLGGEHTTQYTDDASQNCTLETYIISFTNVIPLHLI